MTQNYAAAEYVIGTGAVIGYPRRSRARSEQLTSGK